MDINYELYKIFYYTAKFRSFSQAARELFITQSAVSQSIKKLERQLGGQLFFRKTRNIQLTREGRLLFEYIDQAFNLIDTAENKFLEMQNLVAGEIRLGASDTICKYFLLPHLEKFARDYPGIKLGVVNRISSQIIELLKRGHIDFGVVTLPVDDPNVLIKEFLTVEDIFVASGRFSNLSSSPISLKELEAFPVLMLEKNSITRQNIDRFFMEKGINITPEIELESIDLLVEFARIGLGIACVLKESALEEIKKGRLFEVRTIEGLPKRKLGICTLKNVPISKAAARFIEELLQHKTSPA